MIKCRNGKCTVYSKKGKRLSKPISKKRAKKRLKQIEYFKNKDKWKEILLIGNVIAERRDHRRNNLITFFKRIKDINILIVKDMNF